MIIKHLYDKTEWIDGVWKEEPDYAAWIDDTTMYACIMRRTIFGAWAGLVGIPPTHPLYLTDLSEPVYEFIDVHGNISYTGFAPSDDVVSSPPVRRWWIGFYCMEREDFCPARVIQSNQSLNKRKTLPIPVYRTFSYVQLQVESLASQLATIDTRMTYFNESEYNGS